METGGDVGTYMRKYGVVSEKATTGLLKRIGQFFFLQKKENKRESKKGKRQYHIKSQYTNVLWNVTQNRMNGRHDDRADLKRS